MSRTYTMSKNRTDNQYQVRQERQTRNTYSNPYIVSKTILQPEEKEFSESIRKKIPVYGEINYCRYCGGKKEKDAIFCHQCGSKL